MVDFVLTWNLKKDLETAKKLVTDATKEIIIDWYGRESYNRMVSEENGDSTYPDKWIKECFIDSMDNIVQLLQDLANETHGNEMAQRRLEAVGFKSKANKP